MPHSAHPQRRHVRARSRKQLSALNTPGVQLVYWPRTLSHRLRAAAASLARRPDARVSGIVEPLDTAGVLRVVEPLLAGLPFADHLALDVARVCAAYGEVTGEPRVRLQLARLHAQECTLFHVDQIRHRLLLTYHGPGTEWLPESAIDRAALRAPDLTLGTDARNARVALGPARSASPGTVVLMRGGRWPSDPGFGAVHRSPPSSPKSPRVKLTLDAAPDFDFVPHLASGAHP